MGTKRFGILRPVFVILWGMSAGASDPGFSFADSLLSGGEYYRAVTEYMRYLHEHPDGERADEARLKIAQAHIEGGVTERGWHELDTYLSRTPDGEQAAKAARLLAGSLYRHERYAEALLPARRADLPEAQFRRFRHLCQLRQAVPPDGLEDPLHEQDWRRYETLPRKSPKLAGTLSALLPGAGQLYTGRRSDGLWAFLLNAVFGGACVYAFEEGEPVAGVFAGALTALWYGGNIYNAVNGAHLENRAREEAFFQAVEERDLYREDAPLFRLLFSVEF